VVVPEIFTSFCVKFKDDIRRVVTEAGTVIENDPAESVVTPSVVPLAITLAFGTGNVP